MITFDDILIEFQPKLISYFTKKTNCTDAEDLTQVTLINLFKYHSKYKQEAKLSTYVYTFAKNVLMSHYRKQIRERTNIKSYTNICDLYSNNPTKQNVELSTAIKKLPLKLRSVIGYKLIGKSEVDISNILNIPVGTVKSRTNLAKKELRKLYVRD